MSVRIHHRGVPSVWFLSLDAASKLAVWGAHVLLPALLQRADVVISRKIPFAIRHCGGIVAGRLQNCRSPDYRAEPAADSTRTQFFLTELLLGHRYWHPYRSRIHHQPWPLQTAELISSTQARLNAMVAHARRRSAAAHAEEISVDIWPLKKIPS